MSKPNDKKPPQNTGPVLSSITFNNV